MRTLLVTFVVALMSIPASAQSLVGQRTRIDKTRPVMNQNGQAVLATPAANPLWDTENPNLICKTEVGGTLEVTMEAANGSVLVQYRPPREPVPASCCGRSARPFWTTRGMLSEMEALYQRHLREAEASRRNGGPPPLVLKR